MQKVTYTTEQQSVIDARECNLLVSAAAGSGKTAVLVERILQRLTDEKNPASLDRLLVMTFTRAAADGMRQKISEALNRKVREQENLLESLPEDSEEYRKQYERRTELKIQEALLPRARISTIDSICQGLIRQYFQYLDIDPAFRVADEAELKLMKYDLLKDLLEEAYEEGDKEFLRFSSAFTKNGLDEKLSALILKAYEFVQANPWPEEFLLRCDQDAEKELSGQVWETEWFGGLLKELSRKVQSRRELTEKLKALCSEPDGWKPYLEMLPELEQMYSELSEALKNPDRRETYIAVRRVLDGCRKPVLSRKGCKEGDPEKKETARAMIESLRTFPEELKSGYFLLSPETCEKVSAGSAADLRVLYRLTVTFLHRFEEKKRSGSVVDFSDMEHLALRLLYSSRSDGLSGKRDFTPLADELAGELDEILIDEYQDSNEVQEALIRALSAERFGRPNVFMVGDVKQSIYSFRQAKPELFMEKYRTYRSPEEGGSSIRIELNRNFRSRPEVLETVNEVFREAMKPACGGILYDDAAALYPGRKDCLDPESGEPLPAPENVSELLLVEEQAPDAADPGVSSETEQLFFADDELEYVMIAGRIRELTDPAVTEKPWRKRDIAILLRNSKKAEKMVDVLAQFGIDACFDSSTGYFASAEVSVMLALLGIIDNPRQDIPLAAVLKSPVAGFSDEDLAGIRILSKEAGESRKTDFYDALVYCADRCPASGETGLKALCRKAADFLAFLEKYRDLSGTVPVHELIHRLYTETGYYDYASALPGGLKRRRNLDMLLEKAENYSATGYHGLFNFIRYTEQLKNYETDYGEAEGLSGSEDVVRITTIHKSKGLEYPVTFIAGMSGRFNFSDSRESLVMDEELGFACDYVDTEKRIRYPSMKAAVIREKAGITQIGEELRVLYVAMTRAQEKLIMTGRVNGYEEKLKKERNKKDDIASCLSQQQILMRSGIPGKKALLVHTVEKTVLQRQVPDRHGSESREDLRSWLEETAVSEKKLEERLRQLTAEYAFEEETKLKPKVSVSELKASAITETEFEFVRDLEEKRETKGAAYGTIIHRAFELLDYGKEGKEALPDLPGVDEETMQSVRRCIEQFRKTELAGRMKQAFLEGKLYREQHFMLGLPAAVLTPGASSEELQLLQGIIDAYIAAPEGIWLIDYKTDRVETEETLVSRYALQLKLYAGALEQLLRRPVVKQLIYSTCLRRTIEL